MVKDGNGDILEFKIDGTPYRKAVYKDCLPVSLTYIK
jgi:hypothetical protein